MSFWTWVRGQFAGEVPNANPSSSVGPPGYRPGDPDGVVWDPPPPSVNPRFSTVSPSPWSGWPAQWATPDWTDKASPLVDTAWTCLDLNSSILSTMPTFLRRKGDVLDPLSWMSNPDPEVYSSWSEFAKELFWDFQGCGEAFVYAMARNPSTGWPVAFRTVPPYLMQVEMVGYGRRTYKFGSLQLDPYDVLHIRYKSSPTSPRGQGPLEVAMPRSLAAGLLIGLIGRVAEQGGLPPYWLLTDKYLTPVQADELLDGWVQSRVSNAGRPALLTQGVKPDTLQTSVKEMALLELGQWTESRIANVLGVPPFLAGLPSGGDSLTYSTVAQLFDFHDRRSLRPMAKTVMAALSNWALPRGQLIEIDSDEYTRPGMLERSQAYVNWRAVDAIDGAGVRTLERLEGDAPAPKPAVPMEGGDGA